MAYFTRNRYAAGNVCFILFLAFLFSLAFGAAGTALGGVNSVTVTHDNVPLSQSEGQPTVLPYDKPTVEFAVMLDFQPTTPEDFAIVIENLYFRIVGDTVDHTVYLKGLVDKFTYEKKTVGGVTYFVYSLVYNLVYTQMVVPDVTYRLVYHDGKQLKSVYLKVASPPPEGEGPSAGPAPSPTQTTTADFGQVTVNTSTGAVEVAVDAGKFAGLVQQAVASGAQAVVIKPEIPANVTDKEVSVLIPAAAVTAASEAGKDIRVEVAGVVIVLPPQVVPAQLLADATAKVSLNIQVLEQAQAQVLTRDLPAGLAVAANVLELDLSVIRGAQSEKVALAKPVTVSLPYTAAAGIDENKLGVYRYNEDTLEWAYIGGRVDRAAKTVSTRLSSFSKYTVMAYNKTFADIQEHWAKEDIELMAARWIARGMTETTFEPEGQVTRAQFAALLTRSLGIAEAKEGQSPFKDVASGDWFYGAVLAAYEAGLVKGYEDGTFRPDANITREEMATMVARGLAYAGKKVDVSGKVDTLLAKFTDRNQISAWAREAAAIAVQEGIVKGRTATTYVPKANATRAESTVMLKRLLVSTGEISS